MTTDGIKKLIGNLATYYPRVYPPSMDQNRMKALTADFAKSFEKYSDEAVLDAAFKWHLQNSQACTVSDLIAGLYGMVPITTEEYNNPTVWKDYFEDADGYGYATNSKTGEIDCVWKPQWSKERTLEIDGREVTLPRKLKTQTLRERGIVKDYTVG